MIYKTCLMEFFDSLIILGHQYLWLQMDNDPEFPLCREILTWDGREVAWWHEQENSWILTKEVDMIKNHCSKAILPVGVLLTEEDCFLISTVVNI